MSIPDELKYTKEHEWLRVTDAENQIAEIGITAHAQDQLGDVVFVELPAEGTAVEAGQPFGTVESVKAVSDLYAPVSGQVVAVNENLTEQPETINQDPYGNGWIVRLKIPTLEDIEGLLSAVDYRALAEA